MYNFFSNNQNEQSSQGSYVSDYPPVFFTEGYENQNIQQNNTPQQSFLQSVLNSDFIKQIIPLFFGSKNNTNILSLLKGFNPNLEELIKNLGVFKKSNKTTTQTSEENIIDMSNYQEIK